ncbi:MAG: DNA helicase PcrA [Nitrospirota bacterium]|nr:DNA helicase PcrA [Nitrospirota bacterium]
MNTSTDLSKELNPRQLEAVTAAEGPLLILAGAGSGKTRVITYRIAHLIRECGVKPWNIMAVTFTNKAAAEMKERVDRLLGGLAGSLWVSTFHSACVRILRRDIDRLGFNRDFVIYDSGDALSLIKSIVKELGINEQMYNPNAIYGRISSLKNALITPAAYAAEAQTFGIEAKTVQVYSRYEEALKRNNAADFDDLLMLTVRLFQQHADILAKYLDQIHYLMVDEYQDTNHAQYKLVKLLAGTRRNVCVVGDDDQSIYRFRGADIRNILEFEKDFPETREVKLEQNYRSTQTILRAAGAVVDKNRGRKKKTLWTENRDGEKITCYRADNEEDEAFYICRTVQNLVSREGRNLNEIAFLYRTNAQSRVLEEALSRTGLPYRIVGGLRFYDRKEVKDMLAYLKFVANPADGVALRRIINTPARGIGETTIGRLQEHASVTDLPLYKAAMDMLSKGLLPNAVARKIADFLATMKEIIEFSRTPEATASAVVKKVYDASGYENALKTEGTEDARGRLENIGELLSAAEDFEEESEDKSLPAFLDRVALVSDLDSLTEDREGKGAVTLMTLHSVKGLEFPVVFITGMEEGIFPHSRALTSEPELEEERRLCYVGITRARERLYLTNARGRRLYGAPQYNAPSRFLYDIPDDLMETIGSGVSQGSLDLGDDDEPFEDEQPVIRRPAVSRPGGTIPRQPGTAVKEETAPFPIGSSVRHSKWGAGKVKAISGTGEMAKMTVYFLGVGEKTLVQKYANLTKL